MVLTCGEQRAIRIPRFFISSAQVARAREFFDSLIHTLGKHRGLFCVRATVCLLSGRRFGLPKNLEPLGECIATTLPLRRHTSKHSRFSTARIKIAPSILFEKAKTVFV
jgi:hypothetical protein